MPTDGKVVPLDSIGLSRSEAEKELKENRLKIQYSVGKKPETKKIQSLTKDS